MTEAQFDTIIEKATKSKVPCTCILYKFGGKLDAVIELGFYYPDRLVDKLDDAGINCNEICICADHAGGETIRRVHVNGGKKRY